VNQKITSGHNYYAKDSTYDTALSQSTNFEITKLLLESGANPNIELGTRSPLEFAVFQNRNDIARLLIKYGADVNHLNKFTELQNPLIAAILPGNIEGLKLLLENGAKFKPYEKNVHEPLHKAIRHERLEMAKFLIESGVSTRTKITPKNLEGEFGDCVPCPFEIEPIHSAAQINDSHVAIKFIELLVSNGANINAKNKHKETALSYIAAKGSSAIAKYLIEKGAAVDSKSISTASAYQNNDFLRVLLNNGGNPNESNQDKISPLNQAIFCCGDGFNEEAVKNRIETVNILLEYGAKADDGLMSKIKKQDHLKPILSILEKQVE
jgi:cytohesin